MKCLQKIALVVTADIMAGFLLLQFGSAFVNPSAMADSKPDLEMRTLVAMAQMDDSQLVSQQSDEPSCTDADGDGECDITDGSKE